MAQPANAFSQYDSVGNREDLANIIFNIAPTETPMKTAIGVGKPATAVFTEWQTDSLAAAATNAQIEGDDAAGDASTPTARVGNRCQILRKVVVVTGTQEKIQKAGRKSERAYQIAKKGKELNRDIEFAISRNQASVTGDDATPRTLGSAESWLATNVSRGAGGSSGGFSGGNVAAPTDGTQRALTQVLLNGVHQSAWTNGGDPSVLLVGPFNKTKVSTFIGLNTSRTIEATASAKKLTDVIDMYENDFGVLKVVASRFNRDRSALLLDPEMWELSYLRPYHTDPLAKTGDSEKEMLIAELTLRCKNEAASGVVADLLTS